MNDSETSSARPEEPKRTLEYVALERLEFDPQNPRFPSGRRGIGKESILGWLLESANLTDLMRSIAVQDFFPGEPLLVSQKADGAFTVVEGNRRFAACWLLTHPDDAPSKKRTVVSISELADFRPTELPCLVLPEEEIVGFLGYRHITGIQEWSPISKARYLERLWEGDGGPDDWEQRLRWLASRIGSRSDYVARLLTALALYEHIESKDFYGISGIDEETVSFSLLALALNRPTLATYVGLESGQDFAFESVDDGNLKHLTSWFFEKDGSGRTRLGESRNVTTLVTVLEHPPAREQLESGATLARAYRVATQELGAFEEQLALALEALSASQTLLSGANTSAAAGLLDRLDALLAEIRSALPTAQS